MLADEPISLRNPGSIRPWMHVLDPLSGYLWLGACLLEKGHLFAEAWNFGPQEQQGVSVQTLVEKVIELWEGGEWIDGSLPYSKPEMTLLRLNWDKAAHQLGWRPTYTWEMAVKETVDWFKSYELQQRHAHIIDLYDLTAQHIDHYVSKATALWSAAPCDRFLNVL